MHLCWKMTFEWKLASVFSNDVLNIKKNLGSKVVTVAEILMKHFMYSDSTEKCYNQNFRRSVQASMKQFRHYMSTGKYHNSVKTV